MTVLGAIIHPDRAVMWCDSETYRDGRPCSDAAKMSVNPLAGVAIGSGCLALIRQAARSVQASATIDAVERRLPNELRMKAARLAPDLTLKDEYWCSGQVVVACGHSPAAGRMVCWKFGGSSMFEPVLVARFASPSGAEIETRIRRAVNMNDILGIARRQLELVREMIPGATGASLVVAEINESGLYCRKIPDFDVGLRVLPSSDAETETSRAGD